MWDRRPLTASIPIQRSEVKRIMEGRIISDQLPEMGTDLRAARPIPIGCRRRRSAAARRSTFQHPLPGEDLGVVRIHTVLIRTPTLIEGIQLHPPQRHLLRRGLGSDPEMVDRKNRCWSLAVQLVRMPMETVLAQRVRRRQQQGMLKKRTRKGMGWKTASAPE